MWPQNQTNEIQMSRTICHNNIHITVWQTLRDLSLIVISKRQSQKCCNSTWKIRKDDKSYTIRVTLISFNFLTLSLHSEWDIIAERDLNDTFAATVYAICNSAHSLRNSSTFAVYTKTKDESLSNRWDEKAREVYHKVYNVQIQ